MARSLRRRAREGGGGVIGSYVPSPSISHELGMLFEFIVLMLFWEAQNSSHQFHTQSKIFNVLSSPSNWTFLDAVARELQTQSEDG
jgi:hypothetical protein